MTSSFTYQASVRTRKSALKLPSATAVRQLLVSLLDLRDRENLDTRPAVYYSCRIQVSPEMWEYDALAKSVSQGLVADLEYANGCKLHTNYPRL